jgi:hypothetical protein
MISIAYFSPLTIVKLGICFAHPKFTFSFWVELQIFVVYEACAWVWLLCCHIPTTRPLGKLDFKRLGPFKVDLPLGNNIYCLILPKSLACVHPVFQTLLLLPFIDPDSFPQRIGLQAPRGPFLLNQEFWDKKDVKAILGHQSPTKKTHKYLIWWPQVLGLVAGWLHSG